MLYGFLGQNNALYSFVHSPGLGLQSAIFGTGLYSSIVELCHLFMEYSEIGGHGYAWISDAIFISGDL